MSLTLLVWESSAQLETTITDLIDNITFDALNNFIFSSTSTIEMSTTDNSATPMSSSPENLEIIDAFDFSSLALASESTTNIPIDPSTDPTTVVSDQWDEVVELTSELHKSRVQVANFEHTIKEQQKIISNLTEMVRDLEHDVKKLKEASQVEIVEMKLKNENCRRDSNSLAGQLKVARKLYGLQKYSEQLKIKLIEFGFVDTENV